MTPTVRIPDSLAAIKDALERVKATDEYIEAGEEKLRQARELRNNAIRALVKEHGPSKTARLVGKSLAYVTSLRR